MSGGKQVVSKYSSAGAVVIKGDVTITTDASSGANGTADDGKIHFSGANATILGHTSGTIALTLLSELSLELDGVIGGDSAKKLSKLHINATGGSAALTIPKIGTNATTAGTSGETIIGNTASGDITLSAATYAFGGDTTIKTGGDVIPADDGEIAITSASTLTVDTTTGTDKGLKVGGDAKLTATASGGTIDIKGDILGTDGDSSSVESLTIAGTTEGTIKISGDVKGSATNGAFKTITLTAPTAGGSGGDIYLGGTLETKHNDTLNNIDINGNVVLTAATTLDTTTNTGTIDISGTVNSATTTEKALTLKSNGGSITVHGLIGGVQDIAALKINSTADSQTGAGTITLNGVGGSSTQIGITGAVNIGNNNTGSVTLAEWYLL